MRRTEEYINNGPAVVCLCTLCTCIIVVTNELSVCCENAVLCHGKSNNWFCWYKTFSVGVCFLCVCVAGQTWTHSYLHEVNAVCSFEERLHWVQEFFCFLVLLFELQNLLGVFPHIHGVGALQHLHGFSLVRFQQRMHPLILGSHTLLQFRHCILWRKDRLGSWFTNTHT